jgi:hypothetical protein
MRNLVFRDTIIPIGFDIGRGAGYIWACTVCGDAWGKLEGSPGFGWIVAGQRCDKHQSPFERGGSFLPRLAWGRYDAPKNLAETLDKSSELLLRHEALMLAEQILQLGKKP